MTQDSTNYNLNIVVIEGKPLAARGFKGPLAEALDRFDLYGPNNQFANEFLAGQKQVINGYLHPGNTPGLETRTARLYVSENPQLGTLSRVLKGEISDEEVTDSPHIHTNPDGDIFYIRADGKNLYLSDLPWIRKSRSTGKEESEYDGIYLRINRAFKKFKKN
jgi:hypothetical protein